MLRCFNWKTTSWVRFIWRHMAAPFKREMQVSQEELAEAKVPLNLRDYCAHLFIPLTKCRKENYYLPWKCQKEKHAWEDCQFQDYLDRVRQKREQRKN